MEINKAMDPDDKEKMKKTFEKPTEV